MAYARAVVATDYRPRVERAIRFILDHLDEPMTLRDVARSAHLSEFHFHRIFAATTGESVGRFVTRKRLETAAMRLAYEPERSVTDVALSSGYSSISNFTKAFTSRFGVAPSRVRRGETPAGLDATAEKPDPRALLADDDSVTRARAALAKAATIRAFEAIDLACLASEAGYEATALTELFGRVVARALELGVADGEVQAYGLAFDSPRITAPELCRYHACFACPADVELAPPLFRGRIPKGTYACFRYRGPVAEVEEMYRAIYSVWLPSSGYAPGDFVAIDHYDEGAPREGQVDFEIRIKVVRRRTAS